MAKGSNVGSCVRGNLLTILTITGVVAGVALGLILKESKEWSKREITYVKYIGELFLNMLKGLIIPLIVSSLIAAVGSMDLSLSTKIGGRGILFYMTTTILAIILGIILAVSIQPGNNSTRQEINEQAESEPTLVEDTLMDLVRTMFAPNLVEATMYHVKTKLSPPKDKNGTEMPLAPLQDYTMDTSRMTGGTNIMGLVVFSIVLGIALANLSERGKPLLGMFQSLSEAMMLITGWVIWISPLGVTFLVAAEVLSIDDFKQKLTSLGLYFATVVTGLIIHGFIVLPLIFFAMTRKLPFRFTANMSPAILTAFGTGSSSATLPVSIKCLEEKNHIDSRISRFLLPIGSTINMDGTALYEAVAAIFIAQLNDVPLGFGKLVAISVTATAASIGAAGIPQAGLVTMVMVLDVIGLPADYIAYIVPIDWLLDRFRTAINVLGDSFGAGIVSHLSQGELPPLSPILPTHTSKSDDDSDDMDTVKIVHSTDHENRGYEIDH